jgi:putative ABC transport system permease protein
MGAGLFGGAGMALLGLGAATVFIGVSVLGPTLARPLSRVIGAPLPRLRGVPGNIARENAMRNPKRTARTGGALMIGVAMVVGITVIAANAKAWARDVYGGQFTGDFVVSTDTFGFGGLNPDLAAELDELPEVAVATGIRYGAATNVDAGDDTRYVSIDPATAAPLLDLGMVEGTIESLTADGILVDDDEAADHGLARGDPLEFAFLNGDTRVLTVQGLYTEDDLVGPFVISHALHEQTGSDQFDASVYIATAPGVSETAARAAVTAVSEPYANADVQSRGEYIDDQAAQVDQIVNLMYGLLGLAIIIALLSIANSMALSIHERTRELGLLRAVGMTRRQVRLAVKWEAVLIGVLGTLLGLLIGASFGWAISVTLRDAGLGTFAMPIQPLLIIALIAAVGALLASARPARRAAKLDVLRAIATE